MMAAYQDKAYGMIVQLQGVGINEYVVVAPIL